MDKNLYIYKAMMEKETQNGSTHSLVTVHCLVHNASKNGGQVWASTRMEIGRKLSIACECKTCKNNQL